MPAHFYQVTYIWIRLHWQFRLRLMFSSCSTVGISAANGFKRNSEKSYVSFATNIDPKSCRLCRSLGDSSHRTNIFKASNQELLKIAEHLYGHALRKEPGLPSLVCRPCERRLKHAIDFRNVISKSQQEFERSKTTEIRTKRLVEVSPSIQKPSKSRTVGTDTSARKARMSLDFSSAEVGEELSTAMGDLHVQVCSFIVICFFLLCMRPNVNMESHSLLRKIFKYLYVICIQNNRYSEDR